MSEEIRMVAMRIRGLRELSGYTQEDVAEKAGVPLGTYREYESGETDIPVSFLYGLARLYAVDLPVLLTGDEPRMRSFFVVRRGKGASVDRRRDYKYQSLAYGMSGKTMEPFLVEVAPREGTLNRYAHVGQEFVYVLEGTLHIMIGSHGVVLEAGDSIYFDSGREHAMNALGGKPTRFISIIADGSERS
ncbi:MAG: helix-turn-helix transcriptional regulator [Clostridiales bacterium]|nr:helix-turn-helix transcriptional regulator [Clostridiales bacterium]